MEVVRREERARHARAAGAHAQQTSEAEIAPEAVDADGHRALRIEAHQRSPTGVLVGAGREHQGDVVETLRAGDGDGVAEREIVVDRTGAELDPRRHRAREAFDEDEVRRRALGPGEKTQRPLPVKVGPDEEIAARRVVAERVPPELDEIARALVRLAHRPPDAVPAHEQHARRSKMARRGRERPAGLGARTAQQTELARVAIEASDARAAALEEARAVLGHTAETVFDRPLRLGDRAVQTTQGSPGLRDGAGIARDEEPGREARRRRRSAGCRPPPGGAPPPAAHGFVGTRMHRKPPSRAKPTPSLPATTTSGSKLARFSTRYVRSRQAPSFVIRARRVR